MTTAPKIPAVEALQKLELTALMAQLASMSVVAPEHATKDDVIQLIVEKSTESFEAYMYRLDRDKSHRETNSNSKNRRPRKRRRTV